MKEMQTLKDIKDYLSKIPDEELEKMNVGHNFEGDGEICVLASEDDLDIFERVDITLFDKFIKKICEQQEKVSDESDTLEDDTEPFSVSSDDKAE